MYSVLYAWFVVKMMLHICSGFTFDQNEALIVCIFPLFLLRLGGMCTWGSVAEVDEAQF